MTKSVKEKERLSSIRDYKSKGIPVPAELLKIKLLFRRSMIEETEPDYKIPKNHYKKTYLIHPYTTYFKDNINRLMADIANKIEIYDFKIKAKIINSTKNNEKFIILDVLVFNSKEYLGYLTLNKLDHWNYKSHFSHYIPLMNEGLKNDSKIKPIVYPCKLQMSYFDIMPRRLRLHYKKPYNQIFEILERVNIFMEELKLRKYNTNKRKCNIVGNNFIIGKDLEMFNCQVINSVFQYFEFKSLEKFSEIDIVKMLISFKHVDLNIPDEDLIIENIEKIKNLIHLNDY